MKRAVLAFLAFLAFSCDVAPVFAQTACSPGQCVTASWTSATPQNTALTLAVTNFGQTTLSFNGATITGGVFSFEVSDDGNTWYSTSCARTANSVLETTYIATNPNQFWICSVGGAANFRVRLSTALTGAGTANLRITMAPASAATGSVGGAVSLGTSDAKTVRQTTNSVTTTTTTAGQVVATYTVTSGTTLYLEYLEMEGGLTTLSATASTLGTIQLEIPSGTGVIVVTLINPTTEAVDRVVFPFSEPIPITSASVIRVTTTPASTTSTLWRASFGGYEK